MERKTKNFLWGTVAGAALLLVAILGLITYLYYKGTSVSAEKLAQQQKTEAEQNQRFGAVCSNAVPEAMTYLYKSLAPALNAMNEGRFDREALPTLTTGVKNQEAFLRHCATQVVSIRDQRSLKLSTRLMSASSEFSFVYAFLRGMQLSNCDQVCQQDFARRAAEASVRLENILRGN